MNQAYCIRIGNDDNIMLDEHGSRFFESVSELVMFNTPFRTATSISPRYLHLDMSQDIGGDSRRGSIVSPGARSSSAEFVSSFPMTPTHNEIDCWPTPGLISMDSSFSDASFRSIDSVPRGYLAGNENLWISDDSRFPLTQISTKDSALEWSYVGVQGDCSMSHFTGNMGDPALARGIFPNACQPIINSPPSIDMSWTSTEDWSTPQTIVPTTTQSLLSSSPTLKPGPSTPIRLIYDKTNYLGSSPTINMTPPILPSQTLPSDSYSDMEQELISHNRNNRARGSRQRLERRSYERMNLSTSSRKPRTSDGKGGVGSKAIIPQNPHACSFADCVRRFARREHCKRHEKTVHIIDVKVDGFPCWVEGCTASPFSRRDNLNSHYKTHVKKTPAHRNRYVATLDEKSEFHDPDWQGSLTNDGYPIREGVTTTMCEEKGCSERFHTVEGWQKHMLKEHRDSSHRYDRSAPLKNGDRRHKHAVDVKS